VSTPEPKPKSKVSVLLVSKPSVATSQLESAIKLWFADGDPVSIHTLAVAAHDCFDALSTFAGKPSMHQQWLKSQSVRKQKWAKEPQNFFKHGRRFPNKKLHYVPYYGELLMYDSCICFEHLIGKVRPLMEAYLLRFLISHPEHLKPGVPLEALVASRSFKLSDVAPLGRPEFLKKVLPGVSRLLEGK
jgi:hypothetical protein